MDEWSKTLKGFTYVYLYSVDERFINDYGQLFINKNYKKMVIYSVNKIDNGMLLKIVSL